MRPPTFSLEIYDFDSKFSFQYPTFYGWKVSFLTHDTGTEIRYNPNPEQGNHTDYEVPPRIILKTVMMKATADFWDKHPLNPHQVPYYFEGMDKYYGYDKLYFRLKEEGSAIEFLISKEDDRPHTELSGETIKNQIIKNFKPRPLEQKALGLSTA